MAQEIGVAYVSLLPSGKGFSKGVQTEAESAFQGAEKSSNGFFSNLTKWAKRGAVVVGGMVTAVGALAVGGGISRALNIEDATAKLKGLGHDTKVVEQIMNDALASVKGTSFGLDSAATLAASAVAAGIKPGRDLERYLRLTADAATIAGGSLDELGSVMNNVTTLGAAYNDSLQILAQKGLPIYQWLADEIGVTTDEVKNLASQGKISAETFRSAVERNISGAALAAGDTTRGAFANMMAALSRLGVAFVGDGLSGAKQFFKEITIILDGLEQRIGPVVQRIQDKLGGLVQIDGFGDRFLAGLDTFTENFDATPLGLLLSALKPLVPVFRDLGLQVGPALASALRDIFSAVGPLVPLLAETLADAIVQLAPGLSDLIVALLPLIPPLLELVQEILPPLTQLLGFLIPIIAAVADGLAVFLDSARILTDFIKGDTSFSFMRDEIGKLGGPVGDFAQAMVNLYTQLSAILIAISRAWNSAWSYVSGVFSRVTGAVTTAASGFWGILGSVFSAGVSTTLSVFTGLPSGIQRMFSGVGSWLINSGRALIQGFINGINSMIGNVGSAISNVLDWAAGFFPHSPAKRGPFSGSGWVAVEDGGASLMEQFSAGVENYRPSISFSNLTGLVGAASVATGDTYVQNPFTGEYLLARVGDVADERVGAYDSSRSMSTRGGVRL